MLSDIAGSSLAASWWRWFYENGALVWVALAAGLGACGFVIGSMQGWIRRIPVQTVTGVSIFLLKAAQWTGTQCPLMLLRLNVSGVATLYELSPHGAQMTVDSMAGLAVVGYLSLAALLCLAFASGWVLWEKKASQRLRTSAAAEPGWTPRCADDTVDQIVYHPADEDDPDEEWSWDETRWIREEALFVSLDGTDFWARNPPEAARRGESFVNIRYDRTLGTFVLWGIRDNHGFVRPMPGADVIVLSVDRKEVLRFV